MKNYKIAVAGTGYVGLSLSVLLAQHNQVTAVDIVQAKVDMINNHRSPIQDDYIEKYLAEKELNLTATLDAKSAYSDALDFAKKNVRKVSYAASLGPAEMKAEYKAKLTPCLKQYDSISVREPAAKAFIEEISEKNVKVDVDPTILLPTEKWESLADKSNLAYKNFIFVYTMQPSDILYGLIIDE